MELVRSFSFRSKRAFKEGMDEIRHFTPPCRYEYRFGYSQTVFLRPSKRLNRLVDVYSVDNPDTKSRCAGCVCDWFNHGDCEYPEECDEE